MLNRTQINTVALASTTVTFIVARGEYPENVRPHLVGLGNALHDLMSAVEPQSAYDRARNSVRALIAELNINETPALADVAGQVLAVLNDMADDIAAQPVLWMDYLSATQAGDIFACEWMAAGQEFPQSAFGTINEVAAVMWYSLDYTDRMVEREKLESAFKWLVRKSATHGEGGVMLGITIYDDETCKFRVEDTN